MGLTNTIFNSYHFMICIATTPNVFFALLQNGNMPAYNCGSHNRLAWANVTVMHYNVIHYQMSFVWAIIAVTLNSALDYRAKGLLSSRTNPNLNPSPLLR